jgi:hypothetical protein
VAGFLNPQRMINCEFYLIRCLDRDIPSGFTMTKEIASKIHGTIFTLPLLPQIDDRIAIDLSGFKKTFSLTDHEVEYLEEGEAFWSISDIIIKEDRFVLWLSQSK